MEGREARPFRRQQPGNLGKITSPLSIGINAEPAERFAKMVKPDAVG
jgi:hypothetical protein